MAKHSCLVVFVQQLLLDIVGMLARKQLSRMICETGCPATSPLSKAFQMEAQPLLLVTVV